MKTLTLIALVVVSFAVGLHIGRTNELRTHQAYIQSLNLGGK
jgi:hypothetical protein